MSVVSLERAAEHVALVRINRPDARNALNMEGRRLLPQYLTELAQDASLDAALRHETKALHILFSSEDPKEGMRAFIEKRAPTFKGR